MAHNYNVMNIDLSGKRALVCGSSKGIGKAIAMELAALGAELVLFARNEQALRQVAQDLDASRGQRHGYLVADFNDIAGVRSTIRDFAASNAAVQILVNNSGGPPPGAIAEAEIQEFEQAFTRHVLCSQVIVQALLPGMKAHEYGRIINVVSTSVKTPIPGLGVSNTTRGAMASWAKTLSGELAPYGITVNNILPGYTDTDRLESLMRSKARDRGVSTETIRKEMEAGIPAQRFADPSETGALAGFLASPAAAYITGTSIRIDGGNTPSI